MSTPEGNGPEPPLRSPDGSAPQRGQDLPGYCDLVMKGGVTSGVIYPSLAVRLSEQFKFRSIGGTSAGAIAAAATAAAEYQRQKKTGGAGFAGLRQIPILLAKDRQLLRLFQPNVAPRLFQVLKDAAGAPKGQTLLRGFLTFVLRFSPEVLAGAGFFFVAARMFGTHYLASGLAAFLLGLALAMLWVLIRGVCALAKNGFGFCNGMGPDAAGNPALTQWLHQQLQSISGKEEPLTFSDLEEAGVALELVTTNLSFGRPHSLPFAQNIFWFAEDEFRRLFPEDVFESLVNGSQRIQEQISLPDGGVETKTLYRLPGGASLPVLVAARLSLSFPLLFSAVPLWARDYQQLVKRSEDGGRTGAEQAENGSEREIDEARTGSFRRCWFSDGGLTSNFPIHMFDAPLPRWPTFGVNLREVASDPKVELLTDNRQGLADSWTFTGEGKASARLVSLFGAIFDAARNWRDTLQSRAPGYRDRIVTVEHTPGEGGLNLAMDEKTIRGLAQRGVDAADLLIGKFRWDNQVWIRYRSSMAMQQRWWIDFQKSRSGSAYPPQISALLHTGTGTPPSYHAPAAFASAAKQAADAVTQVFQTPPELTERAPRPSGDLRGRPRF